MELVKVLMRDYFMGVWMIILSIFMLYLIRLACKGYTYTHPNIVINGTIKIFDNENFIIKKEGDDNGRSTHMGLVDCMLDKEKNLLLSVYNKKTQRYYRIDEIISLETYD